MSLGIVSSLDANLLFTDIVGIIVFATLLTFIARSFKQPLIPAYIISGLLIGPIGLGLIKNESIILGLSEIGIAFLLFFVGLEMNFNKLKQVGFISTVGTIVQVFLTALTGFFLSMYLGFNEITSVYIGFILAFSSTSVVLKLLSDKEELDTLHGRIILGILLMQDVLVIFLLSTLATIDAFSIGVLSIAFIKGIALFLIAILMARFVLPRIFNLAARAQEILFLMSLTTCFFFAYLAHILDFSIAIGAFVGGLSLSALQYNHNIVGQVRPLKDFFATLFFVSLGMQIYFTTSAISILIKPFIYFLLIVILVKPLIILTISSVLGYERRTSFLSAISLGQVSEFSLILVTQGFILGHITRDIFSLTIVLVIISIVITSYLLQYQIYIYATFSRFLALFERLSISKKKLAYIHKRKKPEIILFGCHRMGLIFLNNFLKINKKVLVVDYNPERIKRLMKKKIPCIYGDVLNLEVLKQTNIEKAKIIISTVSELEDNKFLVEYVKKHNSSALIIVVADHLHQALELYDAGADYVMLPHLLSGEKLTSMLTKISRNKKSIKNIRKNHIKHLLFMEHFEIDRSKRYK